MVENLNTWMERRSGDVNTRFNDPRNAYERDYARVIHSAAFRRLQSKTQVLGLGEGGFYRTRLTHSLEVSQIGFGINKFLKKKYAEDPEISCVLPDDQLIQSICLSHDIGHPPFGHGGEVALNSCMRDHGGFEGNGQALRILSRLEKYSQNYGMDVTRRTMLGILKYPVAYSRFNPDLYDKDDEKGLPPKCYMDSEKDVVDWILEPLSVADKAKFTEIHEGERKRSKYKSLDTSIMEIADDISYGVYDVEDAMSLGLISEKDWSEYLNKPGLELPDEFNYEEITKMFYGSSYERKVATGNLVNMLLASVKLVENPIFESPLLRYNCALGEKERNLLNILIKIEFNLVIRDNNVQILEYRGQMVIKKLFSYFSKHPQLFLPKSTWRKYEEAEEAMKPRAICDYIAGMTDEYGIKMYEKFCIPRKGPIFDKL